ncbi:hypothetical protein BC829DRAFT_161976 [Chytridium lagenaria]|nr:hypothetical protein BC829DRAFT_161976 [Chytridium lagenaria]
MDVDVEGKTKLDSPGSLIVFSQPGFTGDVYHTTAFLAQAWTFFEQYTGVSYPFGSYKLLFLSDLYCPLISGAGISLLSNHFLFGESIIDQFYDTRRMLSRALASQWFGQFTFAKSCLTNGLSPDFQITSLDSL